MGTKSQAIMLEDWLWGRLKFRQAIADVRVMVGVLGGGLEEDP